MLEKPDNVSERLQGLSEMPFVTDAQVEDLFGRAVSQALSFLDRISAEQGICSSCRGKCCQEIKCELYLEDFQGCPIYDRRPLICRFHYCHRFGKEHKSLIIELRDLCLKAFDKLPEGSPAWHAIELNLDLYGICRKPGYPLSELIAEMKRVIEATRQKGLGLAEARGVLQCLIERQPSHPLLI